jgi:hypothetical protein
LELLYLPTSKISTGDATSILLDDREAGNPCTKLYFYYLGNNIAANGVNEVI